MTGRECKVVSFGVPGGSTGAHMGKAGTGKGVHPGPTLPRQPPPEASAEPGDSLEDLISVKSESEEDVVAIQSDPYILALADPGCVV